MFVATLSTEHFDFMSLGETEDEARGSMQYGLMTHASHYTIPTDWWRAYEDGILVQELEPGECHRDGSRVSSTRSR